MGFRQNETAQMKNKSTTVWKSLQTIHRSDVSKTHDFRSGALVSTQRTDMDTNYGRGDCGQSTQFCWTRPSVAEFLLLILSCLTAFCEGPCKENQESVVNPGRGCLEVIVTTVLSRLPQFCRDGKQNQRQYELAIEMKLLIRCPGFELSSTVNNHTGICQCDNQQSVRHQQVPFSGNPTSTKQCALAFYADRTAQIEEKLVARIIRPPRENRIEFLQSGRDNNSDDNDEEEGVVRRRLNGYQPCLDRNFGQITSTSLGAYNGHVIVLVSFRL
ncbi:hypothetical protein FBUS_00867 [Fasciolopsis buskii]|uniref:Uncharacterized protein n=1 Tax=Fasciolopsis buskii TaxID=27845 RepID=A0A8E0RZP4_9TREM|nr:hypothetical protein FBUS_00867 [Fasciolopsis buski]